MAQATTEGYGVTNVDPKKWVFLRIQEKEKRGMSLTEKEEKFRDKYLEGEGDYFKRYDEDVLKAESGEMEWEELARKYPRRREEIEGFRKASMPQLERSSSFRMGKGLSAFFSKDVANMNAQTLKQVYNPEKPNDPVIETMEDLKELLKREQEATAAGIDIEAILEYFGLTREEVDAFKL